MENRVKIKKGQQWKSKDSGKVIRITGRKSGNRHWNVDNGHKIHEGTLEKYYHLTTKV